MVANIFHQHGVWIGDYKKGYGINGYADYENESIKQTLRLINHHYCKENKKVFGQSYPSIRRYRDMLKITVEDLNPREPWAFKCSVDYYELFLQFNPKIILVKRDIDQIIKSTIAKGGGRKKTEATTIVKRRMRLMKDVEKAYGAKWIDSDQLIKGDYSTLQEALSYCGIEFNQEATDSVINPGLWHKR